MTEEFYLAFFFGKLLIAFDHDDDFLLRPVLIPFNLGRGRANHHRHHHWHHWEINVKRINIYRKTDESGPIKERRLWQLFHTKLIFPLFSVLSHKHTHEKSSTSRVMWTRCDLRQCHTLKSHSCIFPNIRNEDNNDNWANIGFPTAFLILFFDSIFRSYARK